MVITMKMSKPCIEIKQLTKHYKNRVAVHELSLDIYEGECLALLGFNGAGKTTTIKMLSGLTKPTKGDALLYGESILSNMEHIKEFINISPQETAIAPNLSVYDNLVFMAKVYGFNHRVAKTKADEIMNILSLKDRKLEKSKKLSGGLKRRLSIAMALITNPKILFLDEPTLGLDIRVRKELWQLIKELKSKMTIILTSHYLDEVESLADRIAIIDQGILEAVGTLDELRVSTKLNKLEDILLSYTKGNHNI
jgi:ABC-2 type transport system ATP-binding protein